MNQQPQIVNAPEARKLFLFDAVYPRRAAQEQAEKKKLGAFGRLARLNPLNRPKEETVQLSREELRYQPFWHIVATRTVDYSCQVRYQVPVHNPHALSLVVDGRACPVSRQKDKAFIELQINETCHRRFQHDQYIDAMGKDVKSSDLAAYVNRYRENVHEVEELDQPELLAPAISLATALDRAKAQLAREEVAATEFQQDVLVVEALHLYARPVFAFEYRWASADKVGVIEVDGLTGEVVEDGQWFKDKVGKVVTRDMLVDLGAELAGSFVPGGGAAVKLLGVLTDNRK